MDRQSHPKSKYEKKGFYEKLYYIGLDIYKKTIPDCVKQVDGKIKRYTGPDLEHSRFHEKHVETESLLAVSG
jgi:hypothetical protein